MPVKGLVERLKDGENVLVAEGYLFEFERKGLLKAGSFVPEVVIEHPELVKAVHEEYIHSGTDVVLAFTYYGHREKMNLIGREDELEKLNLKALQIAREVADEHGLLMAGNICNTTAYKRTDPVAIERTKGMFKEQVEWAVKGGADFIVGETFMEYGEAKLGLEAILKYGNGLPAVITFAVPMSNNLMDGVPIGEACRLLEEQGAAVVGMNCGRGPPTTMEPLKMIREACKGPIAALPVPYRTTQKHPTFFSILIPDSDQMAFPCELHTCLCSRAEVKQFAEDAKALGTQYVGLCCGNAPNLFRIVAEVYGRNPPALKYSPEVYKHWIFGDKSKFDNYFTDEYKTKISTPIVEPVVPS